MPQAMPRPAPSTPWISRSRRRHHEIETLLDSLAGAAARLAVGRDEKVAYRERPRVFADDEPEGQRAGPWRLAGLCAVCSPGRRDIGEDHLFGGAPVARFGCR